MRLEKFYFRAKKTTRFAVRTRYLPKLRDRHIEIAGSGTKP